MNKSQIYDRVLKALWQWAGETDHQYRPTPRIVTATGACENVDTLWAVTSDNVKGQYFFAQTGQLYLEMALAEVPRVFTMGSSGRAEELIDSRHLREFTLLEVEGRGGFDALVGTITSLFSAIDKVSAAWGAPPIAKGIKQMTYTEAIEKLGWGPEKWGEDMCHAEEIELCADGPVLLTHHPDPQPEFGPKPELEKFFNMKPAPVVDGERPVVQSCDLLLPTSGESLGGAVRVHQSEILKERLQKSHMFATLQSRGLGMAQFADYFEHMSADGHLIGEHYGFGVGLDRVVQYLMSETDIRNCAGFLVNTDNAAIEETVAGNGNGNGEPAMLIDSVLASS
jgi:aspartyl/asparaginyl-tRNA synthetase